MKTRVTALICFLAILSQCTPSNRASTGKVYCRVDQSEIYTLGTNPTADFNVTNIVKDITFNNVTCPRISSESITEFVSRVKREGAAFTIVEDQFTGGDFTLEMEASGLDLLETSSEFTLNKCTIKRIWTGTINTPPNAITVNESIIYRGNCESVFDRD